MFSRNTLAAIPVALSAPFSIKITATFDVARHRPRNDEAKEEESRPNPEPSLKNASHRVVAKPHSPGNEGQCLRVAGSSGLRNVQLPL